MSEMALLLEALRRNARVNEALLDALSPADLSLSDGQGGMSVGEHLEHRIGGRKLYLHRVGSRQAEQISATTEEGDQSNRLGRSPSTCRKCVPPSARAIKRSFKRCRTQ